MNNIEQQAHAEATGRVERAKPSKAIREIFVDAFMEGVRWVQAHRNTDRQINEPLRRRIRAAALTATVSRSAVEFEWPECHAKKCARNHGSADQAFALMSHAITESIDNELHFETTTRPDVSDPDDTPEEAAVLTLAVLLSKYKVSDAGTYARAARLIVDAYPALIEVLGGAQEEQAA